MAKTDRFEPLPEGIILRPCIESDLSRVMEIEQVSFPSPWKGGFFLSELHNPHSYFWVAEKAGNIVGYLCCRFLADEGEILNVAVDPTHRRRGLGKILVKEMIAAARQKRVHSLYLEVRTSNVPAINLYRSFGFRDIGLRRRYYTDGEDALLMIRKDI